MQQRLTACEPSSQASRVLQALFVQPAPRCSAAACTAEAEQAQRATQCWKKAGSRLRCAPKGCAANIPSHHCLPVPARLPALSLHRLAPQRASSQASSYLWRPSQQHLRNETRAVGSRLAHQAPAGPGQMLSACGVVWQRRALRCGSSAWPAVRRGCPPGLLLGWLALSRTLAA